MNYFGTDGIRGVFGDKLTLDIAFRCGNFFVSKTMLIGMDTRYHSRVIKNSLAEGVMMAGGKVIDVGICPSACVAYLTKKLKCDFGAMITASHNQVQYNGIKIFDSNGEKIICTLENKISLQIARKKLSYLAGGKLEYNPSLVLHYEEYLNGRFNLSGIKIVLDCANGATSKLAQKIFEKNNANVVLINAAPDGENINLKCGSLHLSSLKRAVKENNATIGFAFDGDGDRVIAVGNTGEVFDGDILLYILATNQDLVGISSKAVVGTKMTNGAISSELNKKGIRLLRANVGDSNVAALMKKNNIQLGGESSGHIILSNYLATGDGIYTALCIANIIKYTDSDLNDLADFKLNYALSKSINVEDKLKIVSSKSLKNLIRQIKTHFRGRILVRPSGTEECIRVLVEGDNKKECDKNVQLIEKLIESLS
ncbi:MAG: phosphoglucosamine mutase [Clostridia bacterium]|nr:phosphoglucosamine mutase [Clostridia bacterium]